MAMAPPPPVGDGWVAVLSKGSYGEYDVGAASFAHSLATSPSKIVRRDCASCDANDAKEMFYKRLTPVGAGFDLFGCIKSNWTDAPGNAFNVDFELYSSLGDALAGDAAKRWTSCDFDDPSGVGFARDCGPRGSMPNQWNSWSGRGGRALCRVHRR